MKKEHYKELAVKAAKEIAGQVIPFGDIAINLYETIQNTFEPHQAEGTKHWIEDTYEQSLRVSPRELLPNEVGDILDAYLFQTASEENRSYASGAGAPRTVINGDNLIQWKVSEDKNKMLVEDKKKLGTYQPKIERTKLTVDVFDKWRRIMIDEGMPGSDREIIVPTEDAQGTRITLEMESLSPWILKRIRRFSATHQELAGKLTEYAQYETAGPQQNFDSWDDALAMIVEQTKVPNLQKTH